MNYSLISYDTSFIFGFLILMGVSLLLGLLLGLERVSVHKTAGMRTYALVTLSATFFILSARMFVQEMHIENISTIVSFAAAIITGVGFLGAGLILHKDLQIQNVTTAAGLWMCAAIGMSVGFGFIVYAACATLLSFITLRMISHIEHSIRVNIFPDNEKK